MHPPAPPSSLATLLIRHKALWLGLWLAALLLASGWGAWRTHELVGRPFNGFWVQPLLYVSPFQAGSWHLEASGLEVIDCLVAIDGRPVGRTGDLLAAARAVPVGTPLTYTVLRSGEAHTVAVPTRLFTWADWLATEGMLLALAWEFSLIGLVVFALRPDRPAARCLAGAAGLSGLTMATYVDYHLGDPAMWLFMACYGMMGFAYAALAFHFPERWAFIARRPWLAAAPWEVGAAASLMVMAAHVPGGFAVSEPYFFAVRLGLCVAANLVLVTGFSAVMGALTWRFFSSKPGTLPREQAGIGLVGALLALAPFGLWAVPLACGQVPWLSLETCLYGIAFLPLAIAYAIMRAKLFDLAIVVRYSALYLLLSAVLAALYVGLATGLRFLGVAPFTHPHYLRDLAATAFIVALALPMRDFFQRRLDRLLFRGEYDAAHALEEASASMTSLSDRAEIAGRVEATILATLRPAYCTVLLTATDRPAFVAHRSGPLFVLDADAPLMETLAAGAPVVSRPDASRGQLATSPELAALGGELALPMRVEGELVGAIVLGPKRAETPYTTEDLRLLNTLANQSAIALANARGLEKLQAFNQTLEAEVAARTRALELTLAELKDAQAALVHSEKIAALGVLVGGVAHELNNPLNFITGSLELVEEHHQALLAPDGPDDLDTVRAELADLMDACREGATRATDIVKSLRDFSRQDAFALAPVDLAVGLRSTATLVRSAYRDRVAFELELGPVPLISGSAGHLNQVFANLLVNAGQAIEGAGTVTIRLAREGDTAVVTVADTGHGIAPEALGRIFEPFYTTKPQGKGTGLGLSICLGIVEQHGGRIDVDSTVGVGTRFRLCFPLAPERTVLGAHHSHRG